MQYYWRDFQEREDPHSVMMLPETERNLYSGSSVPSGTEFMI